MSIAEDMIGEFSHEATGTRKMLERLPDDKFSWKPHEKSMTMGRLATHLAEIPEWAETIVNHESFDMAAADNKPKELGKAEILELFDKNVENFKKVMSGQPDEHLVQNWKLLSGEHVAVEMARVACLRTFILSHAIHHRGQLSVYLRENDVPLPALYGPSADESI
ncbi:MAG: DinB family protein [Acidobacteriota bacterium]|nr:MAG: DinB family protein [Acidobacteriota bacterium]